MPFKRIVAWGQAAALVGAVVFVIMLFAAGGGGNQYASPGAKIYAASCARCHGADGAGAIGPALANVVAKRYPNIDDQIALVTGGKGVMPAFGDELTAKQIRQVVDYTRTELGG